MKTIISFLLLLLIPAILNAAIWKVDNNPSHIADFTSLQAAMDETGAKAVVAGDIIYVSGSGISYGAATIDRQVFIYGPGYFLAENTGLTAEISPATFTTIIVGDGSFGVETAQGTLISGLTITTLNVYDSSVIVKRNFVTSQIILGNAGLSETVSDVIIAQNFISGNLNLINLPVINFSLPTVSNITIKNNFISNSNSFGQTVNMKNGNSATITNNIFNDGLTTLNGAIFTFNIIRSVDGLARSGSSAEFNIAETNAAGLTETSNTIGVADGDIFDLVGVSTSDSFFALKTASAAENVDGAGGDAGMFGGAEPYVLSGVPALPTIAEIDAPSFASPTSGLTITIQAKARN